MANEPDRVPAPVDRAPRKRSTDIGDRRLLVWEPEAPGAWIEGEPVEVRR